MQNELNKHKRQDSIKWIAVFTAIVVLFVGVISSLVIAVNNGKTNPSTVPDKQPVKEISENTLLVTDSENKDAAVYEMPKSLYFSIARNAAPSGHTASVNLTATVTPLEATNKKVDWTVAWGSAPTNGDKPVTDYVTVTPDSDGSNVATVTCKKAFGDDKIVVTVTTRDGGFTALCTVSYAGLPTIITITPTGATSTTDSSWDKSVAEVQSGSTYLFNIDLNNEFGMVGSAFNPDYTVSAVAYGGIDTLQKVYNSSGELTSTNNVSYNLTIADLFESDGYQYAYFDKAGGMHIVLKWELENGKLKIIAQDVASSYHAQTGSRAGSSTWDFNKYTDNKQPYVAITVTEKTTGISATVNVRTTSCVTKVALSQTEISF